MNYIYISKRIKGTRLLSYSLTVRGYPGMLIKCSEWLGTYNIDTILKEVVAYNPRIGIVEDLIKELNFPYIHVESYLNPGTRMIGDLNSGIPMFAEPAKYREGDNKYMVYDELETLIRLKTRKIRFDYTPTRTDFLKNPGIFKVIRDNPL